MADHANRNAVELEGGSAGCSSVLAGRGETSENIVEIFLNDLKTGSTSFPSLMEPIKRLNSEAWKRNETPDVDGSALGFLVHDILWTRQFWREEEGEGPVPCDLVQKFLEKVSFVRGERIDRIVTGHTPQESGQIAARCAPVVSERGVLLLDPMLLNVDVGITEFCFNYGFLYAQIIGEMVGGSTTPNLHQRISKAYARTPLRRRTYSTDFKNPADAVLKRFPLLKLSPTSEWILANAFSGSHAYYKRGQTSARHSADPSERRCGATDSPPAILVQNLLKIMVTYDQELRNQMIGNVFGHSPDLDWDSLRPVLPRPTVAPVHLESGFNWLSWQDEVFHSVPPNGHLFSM